MAKNKVIKGVYAGYAVVDAYSGVELARLGFQTVSLTHETIKDYSVLDAKTHKSVAGAVGLAGAGAILLGPVGLAAGLAAKSKGEYIVNITWNDGSTSVLDIGDKLYKKLIIQLA